MTFKSWVNQKNMGRLAECDITYSHPIVINSIFPCSQGSNLDHKPFPIDIGHLMHLFEKIFFVKPCRGVLQTGEIFCQATSTFYFGKSYRYYQGRMKYSI